MAYIIPAFVSVDVRRMWPKFFGRLYGVGTTTTGVTWNPQISHFKVGTGGWVDQGNGVKTRRNPVPDLRRSAGSSWTEGSTTYFLQDLDCVVDVDRAGGSQRYPASPGPVRATYLKDLSPTDLTYEDTNILRVRCLLDFDEFNIGATGTGVWTADGQPYPTDPELWEIGIYADHPHVLGEKLLVAYATFPKEVKNSDKQVENIVKIQF